FHVRVGGRGIQIEIVFLNVLSVVALIPGEAEEPLFENRIASVPERDGEADVLVAVADSGDAVLTPAVGSRAGVIVRKMLPGGSAGTIVLADCSPLAFADVGSPFLPMPAPRARFFQPEFFRFHDAEPPNYSGAGAILPASKACGRALLDSARLCGRPGFSLFSHPSGFWSRSGRQYYPGDRRSMRDAPLRYRIPEIHATSRNRENSGRATRADHPRPFRSRLREAAAGLR